MHVSFVRLFIPPTCIARTIAILLHVHGEIYDAPPDPPFVCNTPYNIGNGKCKGEAVSPSTATTPPAAW